MTIKSPDLNSIIAARQAMNEADAKELDKRVYAESVKRMSGNKQALARLFNCG